MGLMDNLRAQVDSLAQQANAGMAKLDNLPVQRKSDALLRSLGIAVLAERTGRGNPGTSAEIDRLITEITQHEAQNNIDIVQQAAQAAAQSPARPPMGQMGTGPFIPSSPPPTNPNVAGSMPGAGAGYAGYGTPSGPGFGGFPEPAPHQDQPDPPA
jgi:hypothetical protein